MNSPSIRFPFLVLRVVTRWSRRFFGRGSPFVPFFEILAGLSGPPSVLAEFRSPEIVHDTSFFYRCKVVPLSMDSPSLPQELVTSNPSKCRFPRGAPRPTESPAGFLP